MRYRRVLTYPLAVRRDAAQPLREQIAEQIAAAVDGGAAQRGARVPSTRTLAELLGVSRGVVGEAYDLLLSRGYLVTRPGSGTFISGSFTPAPADEVTPPQWLIDFTPGQLCAEAFPLRAWRAAWREAGHRVPSPVAAPPPGVPVLRRAVAGHLGQTRGIVAPEHEVVVTSGAAAALRLVLDLLGARRDEVATERPMPPALLGGGCAHLPGDFAEMPGEVSVAVVCPDGNRPLGTVMSAPRRRAALAWARDSGGTLIEVVRDAVLHPHAAGLPRLQPHPRTITVGDFGEVLAPSLRLGYALVPRSLADPLADLIAERGEQPPDITQLAVARLLDDGTLARRMHRLTHLYAVKRSIVAAMLPGSVPAEPGTALVRYHDPAVPERLRREGIRLPCLDAYGVAEKAAEKAFVLGFGHLPDKALREGLAHLVSSLERSTP